MGLSFLKRMKKHKNTSYVLEDNDGDDHNNSPITHRHHHDDVGGGNRASRADDNDSVSRFAILQQATSFRHRDSDNDAMATSVVGGNDSSRSYGSGSYSYGRRHNTSRSGRGGGAMSNNGGGDNNNNNNNGGIIVMNERGGWRSKDNSSNSTPATAVRTPSPTSLTSHHNRRHRHERGDMVTPSITTTSQKETPVHSNVNNIPSLEKDTTFLTASTDGIENSSLPRPRSGLSYDLSRLESEDVAAVPPPSGKSQKKKKKRSKKKVGGKRSKHNKSEDADDNDATLDTVNTTNSSIKLSKSRSMRMTSLFLQPPKRDTAPISPNNDEEEEEEAAMDSSHYQSHVLELDDFYDNDSRQDAGVELELSSADDAKATTTTNNNNSYDGSAARSRKSDFASGRLENMFNSASTTNNERSWNATENASTDKMNNEASSSYSPRKKGGEGGRVGLSYLSASEKKFMSRLRRNTSKKASEPQGDATNGMAAMQQNGDAARNNVDDASAPMIPNVPSMINHDEDASMPSMLTEPEVQMMMKRKNKGGGVRRAATPPYGSFSNANTNDDEGGGGGSKSRGNDKSIRSGRFGRTASPNPGTYNAPSMADGPSSDNDGDTRTNGSGSGSGTFFGTTAGGFATTIASTAMSMSTASREMGGMDKMDKLFNSVHNAFRCNEDTTSTSDIVKAVEKVLKCEGGKPLSAMMMCGMRGKSVEKDEVDFKLEHEERFALEFQGDLIKSGMKLIYHESPSQHSTNPDWIQSTVKLFLRPGNCHSSSLKQPMLAWAVLPVVSRMQSIRSLDSADEKDWNMLGLLDVHSILVDEGGGSENENGSTRFDDGNGTVGTESLLGIDTQGDQSQTVASTGFFSITTDTGSVHVFEAPSTRGRDYVVRGLRAVIARLTYRMIAGEADLIGELYNEDAGVESTGELPNLVTPWRALGRVTHAFLDEQ